MGVTEASYLSLAIALMHLAHSVFWTERPFSITRVFCRLGRKVRAVWRLENETLRPKAVVLPH